MPESTPHLRFGGSKVKTGCATCSECKRLKFVFFVYANYKQQSLGALNAMRAVQIAIDALSQGESVVVIFYQRPDLVVQTTSHS